MEESWFKVTRADWAIQDQFESTWTESGGPRRGCSVREARRKGEGDGFLFHSRCSTNSV